MFTIHILVTTLNALIAPLLFMFFFCMLHNTYILVQQIGKKKCTLPSELSQLIKRNPLSTHKLIEMHFIQFVKYFLMLQSRPIADVTQFSRPHPAPHLPVLHWMSISFTMSTVSLQLSLFAWHFGIFQWIRCELQIVKQKPTRSGTNTSLHTHTHIYMVHVCSWTCAVRNVKNARKCWCCWDSNIQLVYCCCCGCYCICKFHESIKMIDKFIKIKFHYNSLCIFKATFEIKLRFSCVSVNLCMSVCMCVFLCVCKCMLTLNQTLNLFTIICIGTLRLLKLAQIAVFVFAFIISEFIKHNFSILNANLQQMRHLYGIHVSGI